MLADKSVLKKWSDIKEKYNKLLGNYLNYFDLMFKIDAIRQDYGYSTYHNHPNPKMFAQALLFKNLSSSEKQIAGLYGQTVHLLEQYPRSISKRILSEVRKEMETCSKLLNRGKILQDKIEKSYYRK